MQFMIDRQPMFRGYGFDVRIISKEPRTYVSSLVCTTVAPEDDGIIIPPAFQLNEQQAQQLCDALYDAGVRPTNGAGSVGQLAATQAHLHDLQDITRHALKMNAQPTAKPSR